MTRTNSWGERSSADAMRTSDPRPLERSTCLAWRSLVVMRTRKEPRQHQATKGPEHDDCRSDAGHHRETAVMAAGLECRLSRRAERWVQVVRGFLPDAPR